MSLSDLFFESVDTPSYGTGEALTVDSFNKKIALFQESKKKIGECFILMPRVFVDRQGPPKRDPMYSLRPRGRNRQRARKRWRSRGIPAWWRERESKFYYIDGLPTPSLILTVRQDRMFNELGEEYLSALSKCPVCVFPGYD